MSILRHDHPSKMSNSNSQRFRTTHPLKDNTHPQKRRTVRTKEVDTCYGVSIIEDSNETI